MHSKTLKSLLAAGLGLLLPACPNDATPTDTETGTTGTTEDSSDPTGSPTSNSTPPTTTNTTPPGETTDEPTGTTVEPTSTTGDTTGPDDTSSGSDDTTEGPVDNLCTRLGGMADDGIPALVGGFLGKVLGDDKINGYFLNADVDGGALGVCVAKQLGALAGCEGVEYDCQDMKTAHAGLKISQQDFDDFVVDFVAAYDEHAAAHPDLTDADKAAIGDALGMMAPDIIEDPENNLTVYQRVGRKPAIKALVGHPGEAGSFVDNVVMNPAIVGFFLMTDPERLNTCLTRQVSSIDGPVKYGQEVTAPPGIDPGVSEDNPCKDMKTAHAGLMDDMMEGITVDDFLALVGDLITAMTTAGVTQEDQDTILSVLGPMCDDIVAEPNTCPGNFKTELIEAVDLNLVIDNLGDKWDDKYNGKVATMLCVDLQVDDDGLNFVDDMRLKIGMDHTYVGDITIKIVSPDQKIFTPLSRPGTDANQPLADTGVSCCGDDSNLSAMFPFTLSDKAAISAKEMGKPPLGNAAIICKDENPKIEPCEFKPYPGLAPGMGFSDFKGLSTVGTWKVCLGDSGKGDFGKLQYVGLSIDKVKFGP